MFKYPSKMAISLSLKHWCFLMALLLFSSSCKSDQQPSEIVGRALACFNSQVYSHCQESYRLNVHGTIDVPHEVTDEYCNGPCMDETSLVLNCIDGILYNFQFYNGASTRDVRYTLRTGCGHSSRRGDFNVQERLNSRWGGDYDGYGYDSDHSNRLAIPMISLMVLLSCVLLFWAF